MSHAIPLLVKRLFKLFVCLFFLLLCDFKKLKQTPNNFTLRVFPFQLFYTRSWLLFLLSCLLSALTASLGLCKAKAKSPFFRTYKAAFLFSAVVLLALAAASTPPPFTASAAGHVQQLKRQVLKERTPSDRTRSTR